MKVWEMPWFERPGARLKKKGASALSDAELLAIVLGRGSKQENAIDLSCRVLKDCNLHKLAALSLVELESTFGDDVKAMRMCAMFELFRRTNRLSRHGFSGQMSTAEDVYHYFVDELQEKKKEHFYALYLDTKNRVIAEELVSVGILNAALIHPREVFAPALKAHCQSVILVHNHPSGDCTPSKEDEEVTRLLRDAGELVGVSLLDHIVIANNGYLSMKEKGVLN